MWLQRPDWIPSGVIYDNPHVIHFTSAKNTDTEVIVNSADAALHESSNVPIEDIYSRLSRAAHLKGISGDSRLATQLLPHQEAALDFMMQRERGTIPDEYRLWKENTTNDVAEYHHKITGQRAQSAPSEHGGGILADEMGTGKTLSALALIVATLEAANAWTRDREVHLSENIPAFKTLSRATLVVVPSPLLIKTWQDEIRKHMKTDLDVFVYHGAERVIDRSQLAEHDIVLTTYHTLNADHARSTDLITQVAWYRIVLDEAHFIRRTATFLHKRVAELDAKFRWCLTGTPIQNNLDDLGALFAFLSISPFDRLGNYKKHISAKYAEGSHGAILARDNLVKLLDAMCIRRTQDQVNLCAVEYTSRIVDFSPEERNQYNSMTEDMKRAIENIVGEDDSRRRFGSFQAKLQLRLLCNHGTYEDHFHWAKHGNLLDGYVEESDGIMSDEATVCSICKSVDVMTLSGDDSADSTSCVHVLCTTCKRKSYGQCPLCDYGIRSRGTSGLRMKQASWTSKSLRQHGYSSKMEALVQDLIACHDDKCIVFSCWTTTLELVAQHLRRSNIRFEQIDGSMSIASRHRILEAFSVDQDIAVLIMTTGVGAFGLDLIAASRVFLVEPQWNPSVESQAVSRTTRIGQNKTVQVVRYIVRDTVEKDFLDLQRRKRGIAQMAEKTGYDRTIKAEAWN